MTTAQEMARKFRVRDEARLDRLAEDMRTEWKEDQRDQEFERFDRRNG
jgi:hypothetical protein